MKYFFALAFLLVAGCSIDPYAPGGEYYVAPGTFTGTWIITSFDSSGIVGDTNSCTAVITECDENLVGTITNDSTKEVLSLRGPHLSSSNGGVALHDYITTDRSSLGDTDISMHFFIDNSGNTLSYFGSRDLPGFPTLTIVCGRN